MSEQETQANNDWESYVAEPARAVFGAEEQTADDANVDVISHASARSRASARSAKSTASKASRASAAKSVSSKNSADPMELPVAMEEDARSVASKASRTSRMSLQSIKSSSSKRSAHAREIEIEDGVHSEDSGDEYGYPDSANHGSVSYFKAGLAFLAFGGLFAVIGAAAGGAFKSSEAISVSASNNMALPTVSEPMVAKSAKSAKSATKLLGVNQVDKYTAVAKAFIGINPKDGEGSGFVIKGANDIKGDNFPLEIPDTNAGRGNQCTCDCKGSPDGVGCVGWCGIRYRYSNLLWEDPFTHGQWEGMIQAHQDADLNFSGSDTRLYPGGPSVYAVTGTDMMTNSAFSGTFRQANAEVSCKVGLKDMKQNDAAVGGDDTTCAHRCRSTAAYGDWLSYCTGPTEDKTMGFSGYGV